MSNLIKKGKCFMSLAIAIVLALGTLSGCGGGSKGESSNGDSSSGVSSKDESKASDKENVFIYSRSATIPGWDPIVNATGQNIILNLMHYETLVTSYTESGEYEGELATDWAVSDDSLTWTFNLRKDVKWHNGDPFTSADVETSFNRLLEDPLCASTLAAIAGLESVEAPDNYTIILHMSQPNATMLSFLDTFFIFSDKLYKEMGNDMFNYTDTIKPIGTGAFICDKYTVGGDAEFVRNDDWWGWQAGTKSNVDRIIYRPITEEATRIAGMQTGELDLIDKVSSEYKETLEAVDGLKVESLSSSEMIYLGFACDRGIFQDVNARKAAFYAIDRELIAQSIAGSGRGASCPVTTNTIGFKEGSVVPAQDLELAKEYLAKSGYNGETLVMLCSNGLFARSKEVYQAIASMLTEAGFVIDLQVMDNATVTSLRNEGKYNLLVTNVIQSNDPQNYLLTRWVGDVHNAGYKNDEMFGLINDALQEMDETKREDLLLKAFDIAWEEVAPHTAIYQTETILAYKDTISGFENHDIRNYFDFSRVVKN